MFTRSAQLLVLLALAEVAAFVLLARLVDPWLLVLAVLLLSGLGLGLLVRRASGLFRSSVEDVLAATPGVERNLGNRSLTLLGVALLIFPGLLTGLFGALLMVPPVRAALGPLLETKLSRLIPAELSAPMADLHRMVRRRDAVDVDSIQKDPQGSSRNPSAPPELR